jgi:hypothetical protein
MVFGRHRAVAGAGVAVAEAAIFREQHLAGCDRFGRRGKRGLRFLRFGRNGGRAGRRSRLGEHADRHGENPDDGHATQQPLGHTDAY